ncbi:MAG: GntR family transcriptional regulator [Firmicutes bacterium]|nr:GntR family transcriptional regulator [Bacillota bacterium]
MYYQDVKSDMVSGLPLAISIFIRLREDILRRKLKNGEKLTEQRICDEYNVSRTPVREAFRLLDQEGLIQMVPNRGAFVMGFEEQDIADMYDMRKEYEVLAFRWAAERMTEEDLDKIRNAYDLMEFYTHKGDTVKAAEMNVVFHDHIYEASHNRQLTGILTTYQYYTKLLRSQEEDHTAEHLSEVLAEHKEILESLESRDAERGIPVVKKHLEKSKIRAGYGGFSGNASKE